MMGEIPVWEKLGFRSEAAYHRWQRNQDQEKRWGRRLLWVTAGLLAIFAIIALVRNSFL
jgi:hypothetical protein